ncbi:MAG: hypothetical protein IPL61_30515 [Myxococcales bacterium]|nr:hypothetical protein [Myxococcales bacterium]
MSSELRIHLWAVPNPVIIVPAATGVTYCNQVDGGARTQRALEGYLVPLPRVDSQVFTPDWWEHTFPRRLPGDDAAWAEICGRVELVLAGCTSSGEAPTNIVVVAHLENAEAWIHVEFNLPQLDDSGAAIEITRTRGVLTWENSA